MLLGEDQPPAAEAGQALERQQLVAQMGEHGAAEHQVERAELVRPGVIHVAVHALDR